MVLLGRAMVCSHRPSVQIAVVPGTVWPQLFAMLVLTGGCEPPSLGEGIVVGG